MNKERLMKVILAPHISEKSSMAAEKSRQYAFHVVNDATKPEIRQAVELLFDVKVDSVQVSNVRGKIKRFGASLGKRQNWKKAYVSLQPGFDIDFMGSQ
jgi:large subunit ribosomal protein L23